jgi:hypothetical protein
MAQKYTVELLAKTDKAINEIEDLKNEIKGLQGQVSEGNKNTAQGLDTIGTAAKKTNRVLISVGNTLKAIGIGLLLASLEKLREVFASNQKVIDFFNITMEALTIAFNDFFNFLNANVGTVAGYFKSIFTDPLGAIRDMGTAIEKYLIRSFVNFLELIEVSGLAISKFFKGDWAGAIGLASLAGSKFVDVVTGVDDSLVKVGNAINDTVDSIKNYVKGTIDAATGTIELNKAALTAEIQLQGLLEQYDRQAEKLRQVRDEERNTIQERIKANNDLNDVLDEQEAAMLKLIDIQIAAAQRQYDINNNQENYNELLRVTQERSAVLAQIEGFRSEQKSNDLALFREELELSMSLRDADFERMVANEEFNASMVGNDVARLERLKTLSEKESKIREQQLKDDLVRTKLGTQAQVDAQNALFDFLQDNGNKQKQLDREIQEAKLATVSGALGGIAQLVGESSAFGKGIAVSQAIIDTYAGANKALAQGGIFGGVAAAGIIAAGLANVKTILSTETPETPSFAGGGSASVAAPAVPTPPRFNIVGQSNISQLSETIAGQTQEPVKAYVVSSDVTTAQSLERNIVSSASI